MNASAQPAQLAASPDAGPVQANPAKASGERLALVMSQFDGSLGQTRKLRKPRALLYATTLTVLAMIAWMAWAEVDSVVRTQGRVIPSGKPQLVQHLEGGIVSLVYVHEGDVVTQGQNLIAVSDLIANSTRGEKRARLNGLLARSTRLEAESTGASTFTLPPQLASNSPEIRSEFDSFRARQEKLHQTTRVVEEQLAQKKQEQAEQDVRRKGLLSELEVARQQLALVNGLLAKNAASQLEQLDARSKVERLASQIRESETSLPRLASAVLELQARIAETTAQFRSEARTTLADTRVELQRLQQELNAEDDRVKRTEVVAPMAGTVNKLFFNTVGGVVKPGDTLLELTPTNASLVIEARALPSERGVLEVGQKTIVRVAAFDYTIYGTLVGKITEISADSLADERGERYFRIGVAVQPDSYKSFGQQLSPGMTVSVDAVTGQRTVLQYLLSPIRGLAASALRDRK